MEYLKKKVSPYKAEEIHSVEDALNALKFCGFQGRNLGLALDLLEEIESDKECLKVLTLSGAMTAAGFDEIVRLLIEKQLIDVIVSTGANLTHDLLNAFSDQGHYLGSQYIDDDDLYDHRINRIYDIFLPEENYVSTEKKLQEILLKCKKNFPKKLTPSQFYKVLGENIEERCIISLAAKNNIPIFVPANPDSEIALDFIIFQLKEKIKIPLYDLGDIIEFGKIVANKKYERYATIIIGGGAPRNYAQQVFPFLDQLKERIATEDETKKGITLFEQCPLCKENNETCEKCGGLGRIKRHFKGYDYSIRIHTAVEYDGGLSGCTISESKSWGKYAPHSKHVSIWCDATIAFPLLITAYLQRIEKRK